MNYTGYKVLKGSVNVVGTILNMVTPVLLGISYVYGIIICVTGLYCMSNPYLKCAYVAILAILGVGVWWFFKRFRLNIKAKIMIVPLIAMIIACLFWQYGLDYHKNLMAKTSQLSNQLDRKLNLNATMQPDNLLFVPNGTLKATIDVLEQKISTLDQAFNLNQSIDKAVDEEHKTYLLNAVNENIENYKKLSNDSGSLIMNNSENIFAILAICITIVYGIATFIVIWVTSKRKDLTNLVKDKSVAKYANLKTKNNESQS